jgi:hypothetical protein
MLCIYKVIIQKYTPLPAGLPKVPLEPGVQKYYEKFNGRNIDNPRKEVR